MRIRHVSPLLLSGGVAAIAIALALVVNLSLPGVSHPSALLLAAVSISAWQGGFWSGLLATALAALALDCFYTSESPTPRFEPATWVWLVTFVLVSVLISSLHVVQRRLNAAMCLRNRQQSEFMAVLAHELRNFLAPMSLAAEALREREKGDPVIRELCATSERQVRNMTCLVNDLLDVARINQGKLVLHRECVDLKNAVACAAQNVRPLVDAHGHRLEVTLPPEPLLFEIDPTRLDQILNNLLTNAVKYTEPGGRIGLTVERTENAVLIRVCDTGKGLTPEMLPRVFDLFAQAESGSQNGLGIGLNIVRGLVELHGGTIAAFSAGPERGSEFVVSLPTALQEVSVRAVQTAAPARGNSGSRDKAAC